MTAETARSGPTRAAELRRFVRETLGCGCPDEVLADIRVEPRPSAFAGLPVSVLLRVGGRLLVAVCDTTAGAGDLARIVPAGRQLRDAEGFNRVRLVMVVAEPMATGVTADAWADLAAGDERVHLHQLAPSALPEALQAAAWPRPATGAE